MSAGAAHKLPTTTGAESGSLNPVAVSMEKLPHIPDLGAPVENERGVRARWRRSPRPDDAIATQPSVFDDPSTLEIYRPSREYENAHRFDPLARWTWGEEKRVVRKIDLKIMAWTFIMFLSLDLDRTNLSQANSDNFLKDLKLTTDDFNLGNTLFRVGFLTAELPSQILSKKIGPDIWIPSQMVLWSIVAMSQFWLNGRGSFLATRYLIGFLQGGFVPDTVLYLSYFYTKSELTIRLAYFWVSNYVSHIIGAFLAIGLLKMRGINDRPGWAYLFLVEGAFTCLVGLLSFLLMPPGPTQTKAWWRPKGWFSEREEIIMVNRVLRDDPSKSDMHNRQGLTPSMVYNAITDWRMYPLYILGLVHMIPAGPPQTYLTLILRGLGYNTVETNLLTIPSYVIGIIALLALAYISEIINSRVITTVVLQFWVLPLLVALYSFQNQKNSWGWFTVITLITGFPYVHPIQVAWASRNSYSVKTRTISASLYNICVQSGSIIYVNLYRKDDAPLYKRGNMQLIAIACMNIVIYGLTYFFYRTINQNRDKAWNAMSEVEREEYLRTTTDEGNQRLDFRFDY